MLVYAEIHPFSFEKTPQAHWDQLIQQEANESANVLELYDPTVFTELVLQVPLHTQSL